MNAMWNNFSDGQKMVAGLIVLNFMVFLAWKAPAMQPALMRYFTSMPGQSACGALRASARPAYAPAVGYCRLKFRAPPVFGTTGAI